MSKQYDTPARLVAAFDRGNADAYYGTNPIRKPCIWLNRLGTEIDTDLSEEELRAYRQGYATQQDRKEWE